MRQSTIKIVLFALALVFAVSCYKDLSTEASITLSDIEITSELERLDVYYGETLKFTPEVKIKGRKSSDIEYKWEMTIRPQDDNFEIDLGSDKSLEYFVGNSPSSNPYIIRLTVTDKVTGLVRSKSWDTYVASSLGEGILVAHTDDGGVTSELTLLKAKPVTEGYTASPRYSHNLFTMSNGAPIQGRVNALLPVVRSNMASYNLNHVFIGTDTDLIAVNYLDYKEDCRNGELFQFAEDFNDMKVDCLFNYAKYWTGMISKGNFYNCICNSGYLYSKVNYHNTPSNIFSAKTFTASKTNHMYLVDVNVGKFLFAVGWQQSASFADLPVTTTYELKGSTPLACGMMKPSDDDKCGFVLKTADGNYYVTTISYGNSVTFSNFNISDIATDIDDAIGFTFCDNTDFFYYYTEKDIHVVITTGKNATHRAIKWEPENKNEKITGLYHYQQGWYGTQGITGDYEHQLDTHRLQIIITTYDEVTKEGKIYLYGFNPSTGLFRTPANGIYGDFNEITALTPTLR